MKRKWNWRRRAGEGRAKERKGIRENERDETAREEKAKQERRRERRRDAQSGAKQRRAESMWLHGYMAGLGEASLIVVYL